MKCLNCGKELEPPEMVWITSRKLWETRGTTCWQPFCLDHAILAHNNMEKEKERRIDEKEKEKAK
jgi:hypothetical protein